MTLSIAGAARRSSGLGYFSSLVFFFLNTQVLFGTILLDANQCSLGFAPNPLLLAEAKSSLGRFEDATPPDIKRVEEELDKFLTLQQLHKVISPFPDAEITIATEEDTFRLSGYEPAKSAQEFSQEHAIRDRAIRELGRFVADIPHANLRHLGFEGVSELAVFESAAGLWDRGNITGDVDEQTAKATAPLNVKQSLGEANAAVLHKFDIAKRTRHSLEGYNPEVLRGLMNAARKSDQAINIMALKFAQVAVLSAKAHAYIPIDFWTSRFTHEMVYAAYWRFRGQVERGSPMLVSRFGPKILQALKLYFQASDAMGETHIFGYQIGYYPVVMGTDGKVHTNTKVPANAKGAGAFKEHLDISGRSHQLYRMGVQSIVFRNIEVLGPLEIEFLSYREAGKPVGLVTVPIQHGYKGGSPYRIVQKGLADKFVMLENGMVPPHLKGDVLKIFNTNTIFIPINLPGPTFFGFDEEKPSGRRPKQNAGDVTYDHETALLAGTVGVNYENFKNWTEYYENGERFLNFHLARLKDILY